MLKGHSIIKEIHIQNIIANNPNILGLGEDPREDLILVGKEMIQDDGRRLDLLFQDKKLKKIYEVEIQLGQLDESHLLRAVGYWNVERKKSSLYEHSAVVVAEEITPRMLDLIKLFKVDVPIIVIKMTALKKENGIRCLKFERIPENKRNDTEDDNDNAVKYESKPLKESDIYKPFKESDMYFGENKTSETAKEIVNKIYDFLKDINSSMKIYYTKNYIGFKKEYDDQFVFIEPRCTPEEKSTSRKSNETNTKIKVKKESDSFVFIEAQKNVILKLVLKQSSETETKIEKAGLFPKYDKRNGKKCGQYLIRITEDDLRNKEPALKELLQMTYDHNINNQQHLRS